MPFIESFRGVRYNKNLSQYMDKLITLPYDKIDIKKKKEYIEKHPYNFVNLILNDHEKAKKILNKWMEEGILVRENSPSIYFYVQEFYHPITQKKLKRKGIITLLKLEDFGNGIFPHEKTLKKPKEDRLNLLRKTQANLGQIFILYEDKENRIISQIEDSIISQDHLYNFSGEPGTHHGLWKIEEKNIIDKVKTLIKEKDLFIADGHHRYEVSNVYRKEMREKINLFSYPENPEFVMATLINIHEESIVILPTHRYIKLKSNPENIINICKLFFEIKHVNNKEELKIELEKTKENHAIGMYLKEKYIVLIPILEKLEAFFDNTKSIKWNMLDVNILHRGIIDKLDIESIEFFRDFDECLLKANKSPSYSACFFLNPTSKFDILEIARRLEKMPQKSTDFYPKIPSGLVLNKMILKK